jgi:bleomycin hydrolase
MTRALLATAVLFCLFLSTAVLSQEPSGYKVEYVPKYRDPVLEEMRERDRLQAEERRAETKKIREAQRELKRKHEAEERQIRFDFTGVEKPASPEVFESVFHFDPVRQYLTGTCWCFSTTSFFESEVYRLTGRKIKLSEMHTVYYEFLEKARRYVAERGDSFFDEGSEGNAVIMIWRKYGVVPAASYKGELNPGGRYDHSEMTQEMKDYLAYVKEKDYWDEGTVIASLRAIMDRHMGSPPERIAYDSKELTPVEFLDEVLGLDLDQYVAIMSTLSQPFYEYGEYEVSGNWWHSADYYNLPLDEYYEVIKHAIRNGYSVRLNGDVSEPGYNGFEDAAIVPDFDVPQEYIDQDSRELRFNNKTTSDDHDIHLVGYTAVGDRDWFLIKDSASSAQHGRFKGYYFYRDDYVRLKMLTFIVHKDAVREVVGRFKD